jgi:hypothetical protein
MLRDEANFTRLRASTSPSPSLTTSVHAQVGFGRILALYDLPIHSLPDPRTQSLSLFLKRQCGRTLRSGRREPRAPRPARRPRRGARHPRAPRAGA